MVAQGVEQGNARFDLQLMSMSVDSKLDWSSGFACHGASGSGCLTREGMIWCPAGERQDQLMAG
ncbi:hypothetical protein X772_17430 [Mesorhizobium sp. LSJC280B00]|nr:hypothetical protein X772_17430 [Mesorhizobium sp. LSJC280B00]